MLAPRWLPKAGAAEDKEAMAVAGEALVAAAEATEWETRAGEQSFYPAAVALAMVVSAMLQADLAAVTLGVRTEVGLAVALVTVHMAEALATGATTNRTSKDWVTMSMATQRVVDFAIDTVVATPASDPVRADRSAMGSNAPSARS